MMTNYQKEAWFLHDNRWAEDGQTRAGRVPGCKCKCEMQMHGVQYICTYIHSGLIGIKDQTYE